MSKSYPIGHKKTRHIEVYGNQEETYIVGSRGIYVIQSPDLIGLGIEYKKVYSLPDDVERIDQRICDGISIPAEII